MTNDMDRTDTEMMETEAVAMSQPLQQLEQCQSDTVKELLTLARQLIDQGKPSQALEAVVVAVRTKGGEQAVFQSLNRARELYINRLQQNTAVDELASLFAECVIAEVQPLSAEPLLCNTSNVSRTLDADGNSILAETGRTQIVLDAFSDGSSFICLQCGGLVSNHRKDEHYAYWCSKN